jgi:hypothetical protein
VNSPPGLRDAPGLLLRFAPYYLRHFLAAPYRGQGRWAGVRDLLTRPVRRHQVAVYDAVLELMLKGYAELERQPLRRETGTVAVMLTRIGFAFDDEYERRVTAGGSLAFSDVFQAPAVEGRLAEWRALMHGVDTYGPIRDFLFEFVTTLYGSYRGAADGRDFAALMTSATIDSGGLLVTLAHVVARLHGSVPSGAVVDQFSSLGVTAKLADDLIDLRADVAGGRPNLIRTLTQDQPAEEARLEVALSRRGRLPAGWWRRHCPLSYGRIVAAYEEHQAVLTSRWLRFASRLMWTPVLFGHGRKVETRGRI